MKKLALTFTLILASVVAIFAQLNPVNNLEFYHEHVWPGSTCPGYNCFELSWEAPENSTQDTLVGYNIYRDSQLYRFQDYIGVACLDGPPPPCPDADFIDFTAPFWMKVTAVYNSSLVESIANDSIMCMGLLINVNSIENEEIKIQNNPIYKGRDILIKFSNQITKCIEIKVINKEGQVVNNLDIKKGTGSLSIPTDKLNTGFYIIIIVMENKIITEKVIVL